MSVHAMLCQFRSIASRKAPAWNFSAACSQVRGFAGNSKEIGGVLHDLGFSPEQSQTLVNSLQKMGASVTPGTIKSFGKSGLVSLLDSIEQENAVLEKRSSAAKVTICFKLPDSREGSPPLSLDCREGDSLVEVVQDHDILKGYFAMSCGGIAACSTCHVILDRDWYDAVEPADEVSFDPSTL